MRLKSRHALRLLACAAAFQLLGATTGVAQRATVVGLLSTTTHEQLNRPLGGMFSLATELVGSRADLLVSVSRQQRTVDGTGPVCGGLSNPNNCPVEPFEQAGRLSLVGFGADIHLLRSRAATLSVQPQILWGRARTETEGSTTTNRLFSEKGQFGGSAGLELRVFPVPDFPVGIALGGAFSELGPTSGERLLDGYTPFDHWYSVRTAYAGATLQLGRRRR